MNRTFCTFLILLLAPLPGTGAETIERGSIAGTVRDAADNAPLRYVNLFLRGTLIGSSTDAEGFYHIQQIEPGTYDLMVMMMGYRTLLVRNVRVYPGALRPLNLKLRRQVLELGGVKVTADRATQLVQGERSLAGHEIITPREVMQQVGALEDAYRAMVSLPSVVSRNDLNTQLFIRGGGPDQNLVLFDGIEIVNPSRLFVVMGGGISLVNPDIIQSIDLAPGGFEVNYGNKMSALLRINTREGRRDRVSVRSSAALVTARAVAEGPLARGRGSWLIAGRRSYYDIIANNLSSKNVVYPFYYDIHGRAAYDLSVNCKLNAFYTHLGEGAQLYDYESEELDLLNRGGGHIFGLRLNAILTPRLAFSGILGYYSDENDLKIYDTENYSFFAKLNYRLHRTHARTDLHFYPVNWLRFRTGAQFYFNTTDLNWNMEWRNYVDLPDRLSLDSQSIHHGVYWQARLRPGDWLELTAGLRYDYSEWYRQANFSPRAKLILGPLPGLTLWLSSGRFSQYPDLFTIIGRGEPLDITRQPAQLGAERAWHNIFGGAWRVDSGIELQIEVYDKVFDQLLVPEGDGEYVACNCGVGEASGFELTLRSPRIGPSSCWLSYARSEARYRRSRAEPWIYFDYDQRHQFAAGGELALGRHWKWSAAWHYGSGFPHTPVQSIVRDEGATSGPFDGWRVVKAPKNSSRYPAYSRLDLRLAYQMGGQNHSLSAYIEFLNVLNHKNVYLYEWDFYSSGGEEGVVTGRRTTIHMIPFVPSFGISIEF